jgi:hypothetical protein
VELGFLILTDHSEALNGKIYVMGGGWNMIRFPQLPHDWGFGIAVGVDVSWDETNRRHTMLLEIEDPDGEVLGDAFSMDFETGRPPGAVPGQDQRMVMSLGTRTTFHTTGPHAVVVRLGDEELGRSRFYVTEIPEVMMRPTP